MFDNYNNIQNTNKHRENFQPNFNYIPNAVGNSIPLYNQNNQYNNIQNLFRKGGNFSQEFIEDKNDLIEIILKLCISYLNFNNQKNFQNNTYNFENNNHSNQGFPNFGQQPKQNSQNYNANYSNFNSQNKNNNTYDKK